MRRLAGRENRNETARAIDQLQVRGEIPQLFDRFAFEQSLAFDDDEHIEFARRKPLGHFLILLEFRRIGRNNWLSDSSTLSLARDKDGGKGKMQGDEADTLDAESKFVQPFFGVVPSRRLCLAGMFDCQVSLREVICRRPLYRGSGPYGIMSFRA